jgi:hypothetical protein
VWIIVSIHLRTPSFSGSPIDLMIQHLNQFDKWLKQELVSKNITFTIIIDDVERRVGKDQFDPYRTDL